MRPSQRRRAIIEARELLDALEGRRAYIRALDRLDAWSAGFSSGGPSSSAPRQHQDDCPTGTDPGAACACEGTAIDYSDRTGELASRPDPFRREIHTFDARLEDTVRGLRRMVRSVAAANIAGRAATPGPSCKSCGRVADHHGRPLRVPAYRADLCRFCGRFQSDRGIWPPENVLAAHHRGEELTDRLIERMLRENALDAVGVGDEVLDR